MINVSLPDLNLATYQPEFTTVVEFPGFIFHHSLKERQIITPGNPLKVESRKEPLLHDNNLLNSFAYTIGGNTNNVFIIQPNLSLISKVQYNPATGARIAETVTDLNSIIGGTENIITSGYVEGNTIVLGCATNTNSYNSTNRFFPKLLVSVDNGGTYTSYNFKQPGTLIGDSALPVGITKVNFYEKEYYVYLLRKHEDSNNVDLYIHPTDLLETDLSAERLTGFSNYTNGSINKFALNVQFKWVYNNIITLTENRDRYCVIKTHIGTFNDPLPTSYPVTRFGHHFLPESIAPDLFTNIDLSNFDNSIFKEFIAIHSLSNTISTGSSRADGLTIPADKYILWNDLDLAPVNIMDTILEVKPTINDLIILGTDSTTRAFVSKGGVINSNTTVITDLTTVSMSKFNTGSVHWSLVVPVTNPDPNWVPNNSTSIWLSYNASSQPPDPTVDYDWIAEVNIDIPFAGTLNLDIAVDNLITDILVNGVSTGVTTSTFNTFTTVSIPVPAGQVELQFLVRNVAIPSNSSNPTGINVRFLDYDLSNIINNNYAYSDIFVDEEEDKLYLIISNILWQLTLSTLSIDFIQNLHSEPLQFDPPYPPGFDPLQISGVTDSTHYPLEWKILKNFNNIYIYNSKHNTTYSSGADKEFYMWQIDESAPRNLIMFSAFDLDVNLIRKIKYFYDINNELHVIVAKGGGAINTYQYRLNGLAQFNQLSQGQVLVKAGTFNTVYRDARGHIFVTGSDEPSFLQTNTNLFVYENSNADNISQGSYSIPVDENITPFNFENFSPATLTFPGFTTAQKDNFGRAGAYIQLPGDYLCQTIVGVQDFRDDLNNLSGNNLNLGPFRSTSHIFGALEHFGTNEKFIQATSDSEWTYFLLYNNVTQTFTLTRGRSVFYLVYQTLDEGG